MGCATELARLNTSLLVFTVHSELTGGTFGLQLKRELILSSTSLVVLSL